MKAKRHSTKILFLLMAIIMMVTLVSTSALANGEKYYEGDSITITFTRAGIGGNFAPGSVLTTTIEPWTTLTPEQVPEVVLNNGFIGTWYKTSDPSSGNWLRVYDIFNEQLDGENTAYTFQMRFERTDWIVLFTAGMGTIYPDDEFYPVAVPHGGFLTAADLPAVIPPAGQALLGWQREIPALSDNWVLVPDILSVRITDGMELRPVFAPVGSVIFRVDGPGTLHTMGNDGNTHQILQDGEQYMFSLPQGIVLVAERHRHVPMPVAPSGVEFAGWEQYVDGNWVEATPIGMSVTGDMTFRAVFAPIERTVTFRLQLLVQDEVSGVWVPDVWASAPGTLTLDGEVAEVIAITVPNGTPITELPSFTLAPGFSLIDADESPAPWRFTDGDPRLLAPFWNPAEHNPMTAAHNTFTLRV
ncbi:MAG: hypothetical protein FWE28_08985, partial [Oscillospiraceae bacterium]|nr:hypothetical protein [Oscillospiraceae bacterium]